MMRQKTIGYGQTEKKNWWFMSDYSLTLNIIQIGKKIHALNGKKYKKYFSSKQS